MWLCPSKRNIRVSIRQEVICVAVVIRRQWERQSSREWDCIANLHAVAGNSQSGPAEGSISAESTGAYRISLIDHHRRLARGTPPTSRVGLGGGAERAYGEVRLHRRGASGL